MKENSNGFHWECDWIIKNIHLYECPKHAVAVIGNIQKRYNIKALNEHISELEEIINDLMDASKTFYK